MRLRVTCTSSVCESRHPVSQSRPYGTRPMVPASRVALVVQSRWKVQPAGSKECMLHLGKSTRAALPQDCPAICKAPECEDEKPEIRAVHRNMQSVHLATASMQFKLIFQPGPCESMGCCHLLSFRWLINCLNGNKRNKWTKSYKTAIFCNKWNFYNPIITHLLL